MSYYDSIKMNMFTYTTITYEEDKWYKVDILLDWELEEAAFFLDGVF